jgi:uncharacterized protein YbjT (DUF2867 family)
MPIDPTRPVLVYLANGVQGAAVVRAASRRGYRVRALVRRRVPCPALNLPGVEIAEGDLDDVCSLRAASAGIHHVVLQLPLGSSKAMRVQAENALSATKTAGIKSMVLKLASASRLPPCPEPSFVSNALVEAMVRHSGVPFAVVRPTMYLDNLLKPSARMEIAKGGVFAPPLRESQLIAWTSADDCAEAALTLLETGQPGGDHRIAGPESVTGDELTARVGAALGRDVRYREQPIDAFEAELDDALGQGAGRRVASKFRFFAAHPREADAILSGSFVGKAGLRDFRPTSIEEWVRRHRDAFLEDDRQSRTGST